LSPIFIIRVIIPVCLLFSIFGFNGCVQENEPEIISQKVDSIKIEQKEIINTIKEEPETKDIDTKYNPPAKMNHQKYVTLTVSPAAHYTDHGTLQPLKRLSYLDREAF